VWGGHRASLKHSNSPLLSAPVVVCFCGGFPLHNGAPWCPPGNFTGEGAGLALFGFRQVVRSAEIFQKSQALSGFSPERSGGSSFKKFLPVSEGRLGRCLGLPWPGFPCPCVKVPLVSWLLRKQGLRCLFRRLSPAPFATVGYYHLWFFAGTEPGSVGCESPNRRLSSAPAGVMAGFGRW